ncbi:hypothetical protein Pcinc_024580 [Petrolisthes cinctipes]|uniref:Uncharacterized protein n=1 Tax=Petrolisthes cinctipes TaxID=88211 RepID=A0AAE1F9M4_PETCI|nr:hypothetical protein Pcinc_024580 [Petrolisthes cinctipes]
MNAGPPCTRPTHPVLPRSRPVPPALSCPASPRPVSSTHTGNPKSSLCEVAEGKLMLNGRVRVRLQVEPRGGAQEPAPGSDLAQPSRGAHGRPAPPSPAPPHHPPIAHLDEHQHLGGPSTVCAASRPCPRPSNYT